MAPKRQTKRKTPREAGEAQSSNYDDESRAIKSNRRRDQVRKAQNKYRVRQEQSVKDLEAKVNELKALLMSGDGPLTPLFARIRTLEDENRRLEESKESICTNCEALRQSRIEYGKRIEWLNDEIMALESVPRRSFGHQTSSTIPHPSGLLMEPSDPIQSFQISPILMKSTFFTDWISQIPLPSQNQSSAISHTNENSDSIVQIKSATELYGPPDVEFGRTQLKALKSLQEYAEVDHVIDLYYAKSNCIHKQTMKRYIIKSVACKYAVFNKCTVLDRVQALDITDGLERRNQKHVQYNHGICELYGNGQESASWTSSSGTSVLPSTSPFKKLCMSIVSLKTSEKELDEIAHLILSTEGETEDRFFRIIELVNKLMGMCANEQERARFMEALEVGRQSREGHQKTDEMLRVLQFK